MVPINFWLISQDDLRNHSSGLMVDVNLASQENDCRGRKHMLLEEIGAEAVPA